MNARRSISIDMKSLLLDRNPAQRTGPESRVAAIRGCETVALRPQAVNRRSRVALHSAAVRSAAVWAVSTAMCGLAVALAAGQAREAIQESRVRDQARQAVRTGRGDPTDIVLELDKRVRERWGDFESFPLTIVHDDDLLVSVAAPYMSYRKSLIDMLRSGRPIDQAVWSNMIVVEITPIRLGAADIASIELTRAGRAVAPIKHTVRAMRFSNGTGEERLIHAGEVGFAPSASSPGAAVVLTLSPQAADPIIHTFSNSELETLR